MAQTRLKLSITGLAYSIAAQVAPALQPLLDWFTDLIAKNREAIAARIGEVVKTFAVWIRSINWQQIGDEIAEIFHNVQDVAQGMGGWKEVAKGVGGAVMELLVARMLFGLGMTLVKVVQITKALKDMAVAAGIAQAASGAAGAAGAGAAAGGAAKGGVWGTIGGIAGRLGRTALRWGGRAGLGWAAYEAYEAGRPQLANNDTIMRGKPLPDDIATWGRAAAARQGLDPDRFLSLLRTEQGGHNNVSPAGAFGPGQLMPATARDLGVPDSIYDPSYTPQGNVEGAARYMRQMLDKSQGNYTVAEAKYNAGPNNPGVQRFAQTGDFSALPSETRDYVASIDTETAVAKRQRQAPSPVAPAPTARPAQDGGAAAPATSHSTITVEVRSKDPNTTAHVRDVRTQGNGPAPRVSTPMPTTG
jgi:hypothetical protein